MSSLRHRSFAQLLTLARASTGTYFGSDGSLKTAAADQPRLEYDPDTRQLRGLLIEEARTNLCLQSGTPVVWGSGGGVSIATGQIAPDGSTSAIAGTATVPGQGFYQVYSTTNGVRYTFSLFLEWVSGGEVVRIGSDQNPTTATLEVNVRNGAITSVGAGIVASGVERRADGYVRVWGSFVSTATTGSLVAFSTGAQVFRVWGGQVEAGDFPTSFIPTAASAATRAADSITAPLDEWFTDEDAGTLFAEYMVRWPAVATGTEHVLAQIDAGNGLNFHRLLVDQYGNRETLCYAGGALQSALSSGTVTAGRIERQAYAWQGGAARLALQDRTSRQPVIVRGTYGAAPAGLTTLRLGRGHAAGVELGGYLRRFRYFPRSLSDSELLALVAA